MSKKIIVGNTVATPVVASDWSQTDETKIDYIKNKPTLGTLAAKDKVSKADLGSDIIESIDEIKSTIQSIYTVPYYSPSTITEAQKEEIREIITAIASEKADYALFMKVNNGIIPASYIEDSRNKTIRATLHDINNRTYQIVLSKAGEVTVSQETIYIMDQEKIESASTKAVVGSVMAGYVQDYVAEHGGSGAPVIHIVPYYKQSTITTGQKSEILDAIEKIKADTEDYVVSISVGGFIIPAIHTYDLEHIYITAILHNETSVKYGIKVTSNNVVTTFENEVFVVDDSLNDKSENPVKNKVVTTKITEIEATVGNIDLLLGTI
jgi:hypothetical protein